VVTDPPQPGSDGLGATAASIEPFALAPFVRSAGIVSLSSVAGLLRAVVMAKLFAIVLGPSAVGILAQLLNFSGLISTVVALGLTTGVSKMVAEANQAHENKEMDAVVTTAVVLSCGAGLAAVVILAPFGSPLSFALTGTSRYSALVLLMTLSFPLYNIASVLSYVVQGLADISGFTWANVVNALATIVIVVPATLLWGLLGAMVAILIGSAIQCTIFAWVLRRAYLVHGWRMPKLTYNSRLARKLLRYGAVMLVGSVAVWASVFAVRTIGIHLLGTYQNGLYQVAYGLSGQYTTIFMMWMAAYVFPRIAGHRDGIQLSEALNSALRANLLLMVPGLALVIGFRNELITIFYSGSFAAAAPLIVWQALGDYARVVGWSFGVSLFARGRTGSHLLGVAAQSAGWVAASVFLIPRYGTTGIAAGYAISFVLWPAIMFPIAHHWFGVNITRTNVALIVIGLGVLGAAAIVPWPIVVVLAGVLPAAIFMLNRGQRSPDGTAVPRSDKTT
jgi:O-antigen/teichoic acid export membrane protein